MCPSLQDVRTCRRHCSESTSCHHESWLQPRTSPLRWWRTPNPQHWTQQQQQQQHINHFSPCYIKQRFIEYISWRTCWRSSKTLCWAPLWWAGRSPVCEDVLEADEGLCECVQFVHGGVDAVETRAVVWNLLTVGDDKEEPAIDLKRLPVRRSNRLKRENTDMKGNYHQGFNLPDTTDWTLYRDRLHL